MKVVLQLVTITETSSKVSDYNLYKYLYMPFGIQNIPATFQWLMDVVLHDVVYCCRAYIDDIVEFSSSWENHCFSIYSCCKEASGVKTNTKNIKM